jgi:hypothetical protein
MNMSKFEVWLENSDFGYYGKESEDCKYVEYLINVCNGIVVRCYYGMRKAEVKNSDGTWMEYSYKKLIQELEQLS